jgi:hypothetical protein
MLCQNARYAIACYDINQGPHMGNFYCDDTNNWKFYNSCSDVNLAYPKIGIPESFMVESYEVFQVIKK